jgi:hypothetical protein
MELIYSPSGYCVDLPDELRILADSCGSSMMDADELLHLAGALAAYPWDTDAIVVEIGAYIGRTTVFIANVLHLLGHRVPILSIDPFERAQPDSHNPQGIYAAYIENITADRNLEELCLPLVAFSQHAAPVVPDRIGVLVIDGGHHYPTISADLRLYGPKVLPNGLMFIDDYGPAYPDVMRAVDEYFTPANPLTILHKSHFVIAQQNAAVASLWP